EGLEPIPQIYPEINSLTSESVYSVNGTNNKNTKLKESSGKDESIANSDSLITSSADNLTLPSIPNISSSISSMPPHSVTKPKSTDSLVENEATLVTTTTNVYNNNKSQDEALEIINDPN